MLFELRYHHANCHVAFFQLIRAPDPQAILDEGRLVLAAFKEEKERRAKANAKFNLDFLSRSGLLSSGTATTEEGSSPTRRVRGANFTTLIGLRSGPARATTFGNKNRSAHVSPSQIDVRRAEVPLTRTESRGALEREDSMLNSVRESANWESCRASSSSVQSATV